MEKGGEKDQDKSMLKEAAEGKRKSGQKKGTAKYGKQMIDDDQEVG